MNARQESSPTGQADMPTGVPVADAETAQEAVTTVPQLFAKDTVGPNEFYTATIRFRSSPLIVMHQLTPSGRTLGPTLQESVVSLTERFYPDRLPKGKHTLIQDSTTYDTHVEFANAIIPVVQSQLDGYTSTDADKSKIANATHLMEELRKLQDAETVDIDDLGKQLPLRTDEHYAPKPSRLLPAES